MASYGAVAPAFGAPKAGAAPAFGAPAPHQLIIKSPKPTAFGAPAPHQLIPKPTAFGAPAPAYGAPAFGAPLRAPAPGSVCRSNSLYVEFYS